MSLSTMNIPLLILGMIMLDAAFCEVPRSTGPLSEVVAIEGGTAMLPCNITPPTARDSPILVLFYNGVTGMPVYSIDARSTPLESATLWSDLGERAKFDMHASPQGLRLKDVLATDDGDYRCRVDFGASPTRNLRVKLMVVVPPRRVSITNPSGLEVSGIIGPYQVRKTLTLTCQTAGGKPRPKITWWHEESLLDEVMEYKVGEIAQNVLTLPNLSRQHLFRVLTCKASNSNMTRPLEASVKLDLIFPPLEVRILDNSPPLSESKRYRLVCEAMGSRPPASLSWYLDNAIIPDSKEQHLHDGNMTRSEVVIHPERKHNGAILACRAENPKMEATAVEDAIKLNVYYSPSMHLRAGQSLDITNIKEGDDVYFECDIEANPAVSRVQWFLDGQELLQNIVEGVILSSKSLVLQKVKRSSSGFYTCRGTNDHGTATSNALELRVKFSPVCSEGQKWVYGGGRRQAVNVSCEVEGHPPASFFKWAFNTSSEYMDIPPELVHPEVGKSVVTYTPQTHHDFGSLLCWGINDVNVQQQPCVFHVVPAAPPESVHNCSAWHNASAAGEVVVACQAGWSGGLAQSFTLEVREGPSTTGSRSVLASLTDQLEPHFTVTGLTPGAEYELAVVASNAQGTAKPTRIIYLTPIDVAEKRTSAAAADSEGSFKHLAMTPLLAVLTGVVVSAILLCIIILVVVLKIRNSHSRSQTQTKILYDKASPNTTGCDEGGFIQQQTKPQQDAQPDIIRVKTEALDVDDCDIQLAPERTLPLDESYCDSSSSLINNAGGCSVPSETDTLLQSAAKESSRFASGTSTTFHTGSLGRKSYSSIGHETPPVSYPETSYSLRRQKGFHSQDSDCDSAQIPLVMSSQSGTRESCV